MVVLLLRRAAGRGRSIPWDGADATFSTLDTTTIPDSRHDRSQRLAQRICAASSPGSRSLYSWPPPRRHGMGGVEQHEMSTSEVRTGVSTMASAAAVTLAGEVEPARQIELLRTMPPIRRFEETAEDLYLAGEL